ncbi:MAG TPA: cyanophycinase [Thermomicrobiales bacterium]|nr:cyanophycinase [Thermomicrobiales bacterium]
MAEAKESPVESNPVASSEVRRVAQGPVMPIGGAEDKDGDGDEAILQRFVDLAGGKKARIVVVPTASEHQEEMGQKYTDIFTALGAKSVEVLNIQTREETNADPAIEMLEKSTGIFITGGAQSRLVTLLSGTLAMECIRERNARGVVVAGTSAGASIVASHLMLGGTGLAGNSGSSAARKHMVEMAAGFGPLQDIIIDQHFSERGRMGRLLSVYAANPGLLSVGLDEDTAVVIDKEGIMEVLGTGMVTVVNGRNAVSDTLSARSVRC